MLHICNDEVCKCYTFQKAAQAKDESNRKSRKKRGLISHQSE